MDSSYPTMVLRAQRNREPVACSLRHSGGESRVMDFRRRLAHVHPPAGNAAEAGNARQVTFRCEAHQSTRTT
jgi:hypothetical protein